MTKRWRYVADRTSAQYPPACWPLTPPPQIDLHTLSVGDLIKIRGVSDLTVQITDIDEDYHPIVRVIDSAIFGGLARFGTLYGSELNRTIFPHKIMRGATLIGRYGVESFDEVQPQHSLVGIRELWVNGTAIFT